MAEADLVTVSMKENRDNPEGCTTTKVVEVSVAVGDGKFETRVNTISVRGLENACKYEKNKTCTAYACYAN